MGTIKNNLLFTEENLLEQIESGRYELGFYHVQFYSRNNLPVNEVTETIADYYLYPSGGALRDREFNIVFYSTRFDIYKGFLPPHLKLNSDAEDK